MAWQSRCPANVRRLSPVHSQQKLVAHALTGSLIGIYHPRFKFEISHSWKLSAKPPSHRNSLCLVLTRGRTDRVLCVSLHLNLNLRNAIGVHLLYERVSLASISFAFLVEDSMAAMREACSLQLFSSMPLYRTCTPCSPLATVLNTSTAPGSGAQQGQARPGAHRCQLELCQVLHKLGAVRALKLVQV